VGKGSKYGDTVRIGGTIGLDWKKSHEEYILLLENAKYIFTWDQMTGVVFDAIVYGCIPVIVSKNPWTFDEINGQELSIPYLTLEEFDNKEKYFDGDVVFLNHRDKMIEDLRLFQNTTKEWVTTVILHELLHGIISVEKPNLTTNRQQHTWMFDNLVPITIAQSLRELFPTINDYDAIALGLDGMSEGYLISGTNTIDPTKDAFAQQNYFQNLNQAITSASNYRDAVAGFGTSFC
jgi:hypothetical protein